MAGTIAQQRDEDMQMKAMLGMGGVDPNGSGGGGGGGGMPGMPGPAPPGMPDMGQMMQMMSQGMDPSKMDMNQFMAAGPVSASIWSRWRTGLWAKYEHGWHEPTADCYHAARAERHGRTGRWWRRQRRPEGQGQRKLLLSLRLGGRRGLSCKGRSRRCDDRFRKTYLPFCLVEAFPLWDA
jgi:hypothetical protein